MKVYQHINPKGRDGRSSEIVLVLTVKEARIIHEAFSYAVDSRPRKTSGPNCSGKALTIFRVSSNLPLTLTLNQCNLLM